MELHNYTARKQALRFNMHIEQGALLSSPHLLAFGQYLSQAFPTMNLSKCLIKSCNYTYHFR